MYKWLIIINVKVFFYWEYRLLELNFKKEDFITNISNVYVTASDIIFFWNNFYCEILYCLNDLMEQKF